MTGRQSALHFRYLNGEIKNVLASVSTGVFYNSDALRTKLNKGNISWKYEAVFSKAANPS